MTVVTEETLTQLNADVSLPRYDRHHVTTGIVHIGVGNFHRSHQAMYIDTLTTITSRSRTSRADARCRKSAREARTLRCARATFALALARFAEPRWQRAMRRW